MRQLIVNKVALTLTAIILAFAAHGVKAEEILLSCEYSDKSSKFDLDINDKRVLKNGENKTINPWDYVDISSRYITYGSRRIDQYAITTAINRESGDFLITIDFPPSNVVPKGMKSSLSGSCVTAHPTRKF
jgi:hypothetical protein